MCCRASLYGRVAISLDRFFAISFPLAYKVHGSNRSAAILIAMTWIYSIVLAIPYVGNSEIHRALLIIPQNYVACLDDSRNWQADLLIANQAGGN